MKSITSNAKAGLEILGAAISTLSNLNTGAQIDDQIKGTVSSDTVFSQYGWRIPGNDTFNISGGGKMLNGEIIK